MTKQEAFQDAVKSLDPDDRKAVGEIVKNVRKVCRDSYHGDCKILDRFFWCDDCAMKTPGGCLLEAVAQRIEGTSDLWRTRKK